MFHNHAPQNYLHKNIRHHPSWRVNCLQEHKQLISQQPTILYYSWDSFNCVAPCSLLPAPFAQSNFNWRKILTNYHNVINCQIETKLRAFCTVELWRSSNFQPSCQGRQDWPHQAQCCLHWNHLPQSLEAEIQAGFSRIFKAKAGEWRTHQAVVEANQARGE